MSALAVFGARWPVNVLSRAESVVITHRDWEADGCIPVAALDRAVGINVRQAHSRASCRRWFGAMARRVCTPVKIDPPPIYSRGSGRNTRRATPVYMTEEPRQAS